MKLKYSLFEKFAAYILLVISLFLQSCNSPNVQPIAPQSPNISTEEQMISFYQEAGQLKAIVKQGHGSLSASYTLPVYISSDVSLAQLVTLTQEGQKQLIHINLPKEGQHGYVCVGHGDLRDKEDKQEYAAIVGDSNQKEKEKEGQVSEKVAYRKISTEDAEGEEKFLKVQELEDRIIQHINRAKDEAIIKSINYTLESFSPNGKWSAKVILDAFREKKEILDFGHVAFHERDFELISNHPFFREKAKGIKFSNLDNLAIGGGRGKFIRSLATSLQSTNIIEVELSNSNLKAESISLFVTNLKGAQVKRVNFKYNQVGNEIQQWLSSNYLANTTIEEINLKHNKVETSIQQLLIEKYNHIHWIF
ncbi:hypothetical protein Aasi_1862 [Candidatus Amoebophilus asiaticus 5a2]|uniref:Uncharacterized protein n=1 Tax=Amoebophilus asiaticus (strain 5a2) TaxID=452471 RepID=C3L459_AMOA5|nr:hypothetical protein [Candidatus Amoebophilus asiaticus]ACP21100.1 hypothetical protein Aasi_1862 [Candidatus Amoebophilus asiaticus 5a2]